MTTNTIPEVLTPVPVPPPTPPAPVEQGEPDDAAIVLDAEALT